MSDFKYTPDQKTLPKLLFKSIYTVPKYQRPYSWKADNIDDLWTDIMEEDDHFIGVIVLKNRQDNTLEIIDGQQRLITLTICLAALRNMYLLSEEPSSAKKVQKLIIGEDYYQAEMTPVITPGRNLKDFFKKYVQTIDGDNHEIILTDSSINTNSEIDKVIKNYKLVVNHIESSTGWKKSSKQFLDLILNKLERVQVLTLTVNNDDNAFALFETLNFKLAKLSEIDLIKNRLFMELSTKLSENEIERSWRRMVELVAGSEKEPEKIKSFIQYYWWSRHGKESLKKIFKELRSSKIASEFKLMGYDAEIYNVIDTNGPDMTRWHLSELKKVSDMIPRLRQINVPMLALARIQARDDYPTVYKTQSVKKLAQFLPKFIIAYRFSDKSPAIVERIYSKYSIQITDCRNATELDETINNFINELKQKFPLEEEFLREFNLKYRPRDKRNNNLISYLMEKIMSPTGELKFDEANLEHIFPQHPSGEILPSERSILEKVHDIGNIFPLGIKINSGAANLRPRQKLDYYAKSKIPVAKELYDLIEISGWDESAIDTRTEKLKKEIWAFLSPDLSK